MTDKNADERIERVYAFLCASMAERGYAPSLREIGLQCYLGRSTVLLCLARLEDRGRIRRDPGKARSITLVQEAPE